MIKFTLIRFVSLSLEIPRQFQGFVKSRNSYENKKSSIHFLGLRFDFLLLSGNGCVYARQALTESTMSLDSSPAQAPKGHALHSENLFPLGEDLFFQQVTFDTSRHKNSKQFQCEICGKQFTESGTKKVHFESVHNHAVFPCECGKVYKYMRALRRHRNSGTCELHQGT